MTAADVIIAEAARRYVGAWHRIAELSPRADLGETIAFDDALHALIVAVDRACPLCDLGTCPLAPDVVDVVETGGRL